MGREYEAGQLVILNRSLAVIMGYLDLREILLVLAPMNKLTYSVIKEENF